MRQVHSQNTGPELLVRKKLHAHGFRFRLHDARLPGKPDIVLPKYTVAVFVNGCLWHGHFCKKGKIPGSNSAYWASKIQRNVERDNENYRQLENVGWSVVVLWTCNLNQGLADLLAFLKSMRTVMGTSRSS